MTIMSTSATAVIGHDINSPWSARPRGNTTAYSSDLPLSRELLSYRKALRTRLLTLAQSEIGDFCNQAFGSP